MSTAPSGSFALSGFANPERPFGLDDVLRLLARRWWSVIKFAVAFVVLTAIVLLLWPSSYSATAVVMLDPRKNNITDRSQVLSGLPTDPASVQDQIQILTSHDLAALIVDRQLLARDPEFSPALKDFPFSLFAQQASPDAQRSAIVETFLKHLTVESEGLSTAVSVTFRADDPEKAARVANALVRAYIDLQVGQKSDAAQRTTAWLTRRIAQLAHQSQAADAAVQAYKAANGLNDSGQGTPSLVDQQLAAINTQLVQAQADLAEKEASYNHVDKLVKSGHAAEVSQVVASPLMVQLRQQQADAIRNAADLDSRYGPKHPKRIAMESQLHDLDSKVEQEAVRIAGSVANDVAVARAQARSLEDSLARVRAQSNEQNAARVKLRGLEASAASTRSMYEAFVTRLREVQDQAAVTVPDARIISHAPVPARPSSPPRTLIFCASLPAGLLLGLLYALIMERAGQFSAEQEIVRAQRLPQVPVVAVIPEVRDVTAADQLVAPASSLSRALRGLAERLTFFPAASRPRTILVGGFDSSAIVAAVAVGIARSLALLGHNVILVDADLARSGAARLAGSTIAGKGVLDVLRGGLPLSRAMSKDRSSSVLVLANAPSTASAKAQWESEGARALFEHLRRASDFVVIHAPAQVDTVPLASMAEAILFVGPARRAQSLEQAVAAFAPHAQNAGLVLAG